MTTQMSFEELQQKLSGSGWSTFIPLALAASIALFPTVYYFFG